MQAKGAQNWTQVSEKARSHKDSEAERVRRRGGGQKAEW